MKQVRFTQNYAKAKGFALIELVVTSFLGLVLMSMILTTTILNKKVMGRDTARTKLMQNLRGSMDIAAFDMRVAGENLPRGFPAVLLTNGTGSNADTLTIRRNLVDDVLNLCAAISASSTTTQVKFAIPGTTAGCVYSSMTTAYNSWHSYRLAQGGTTDAFIWDRVNKRGEFFRINNDGSNGTSYWITRASGTWANSYALNTSNIYLLEEWQYKLNSDTLQLVQNQDSANPLNLSFGITNFQVSIVDTTGATLNAFTTAEQWANIRSINISISGKERYSKQDITRTLNGSFFPRNILSL